MRGRIPGFGPREKVGIILSRSMVKAWKESGEVTRFVDGLGQMLS